MKWEGVIVRFVSWRFDADTNVDADADADTDADAWKNEIPKLGFSVGSKKNQKKYIFYVSMKTYFIVAAN